MERPKCLFKMGFVRSDARFLMCKLYSEAYLFGHS